MLIRVGYEIAVEVTSPTAVYTYLNVHPQHKQDIVWACAEESTGTRHIDIHGNEFVRQTLPEGETVLSHDAIVEVSGLPDVFNENAAQVDPAQLPAECLPYLLGSRYCETDRMSQIAWTRFGHYQGGAERVRAICDFVNAHLSFSYGYARSTRTALEAYNERVGVCRDFAHLVITLCRALNIPARYANGFMGDIGVPADPSRWITMPGLKSIWTASGLRWMPVTTSRGSGAYLLRVVGTPVTSPYSQPLARIA